MTKSSSTRAQRWLALAWLALVLTAGGHTLWLWLGDHLQIDTDVLAMLPQNQRDPAVQAVTRQLTDAASRRIVVVIGGRDWNAARQGGDAFASALAGSGAKLQVRYRAGNQQAAQWLDFFAPYHAQLLSVEQRHTLNTLSPQQLSGQALAALYQPMGMPRFVSWGDDPLNLYANWLAQRAEQSPVRVNDGRLALSHNDQQYTLLMLEQAGSAFSMSEQQALLPILERARQAALSAAPGVEVLVVGVPIYAAAAANQAQREVHTIGIGSLCGIVLLTLIAFSAIRPRILVTLSIAIGLICALSLSSLLFTRLHLITLVFGASLVGVAENYGTNYFSNRLGWPEDQRWAILRRQSPSMWLAMLTTAIGYLLLALAPFPGLRQIALFSVVGLLSAFITVQLWFPFLDRGTLNFTRFARWIGNRRAAWPTLGKNRATLLLTLAIGITLCGALRLHSNDDIRLLQNTPASLIAEQIRLNTLLDLPGPAQFYLIRGTSPEQVLQREEALKNRLDPLIGASGLGGYQAVSDWVPSIARQSADAAFIRRAVDVPQGVRARVAAQLGSSSNASATPFKPLLVDQWLAAPVSEPLRFQWLGRFENGYASVILLRGADRTATMRQLAALPAQLSGVQWVDKVDEISSILERYRHIMGWVILASYALVFIALCLRFGRQGWRALLPTLLASALSLALLALMGQPIQLFNVLALLLILGMGVDYGIFLLAQPDPREPRAFLSVSLAAVSTLLSFGLLALSSTPALRAFGLTMMFGICLSWLLMPFFLPAPHTETPSNAAPHPHAE